MTFVNMKLKMKTFVGDAPELVDGLHNDFVKDHKVKFTQTNLAFSPNGRPYYVVVELYEEE